MTRAKLSSDFMCMPDQDIHAPVSRMGAPVMVTSPRLSSQDPDPGNNTRVTTGSSPARPLIGQWRKPWTLIGQFADIPTKTFHMSLSCEL